MDASEKAALFRQKSQNDRDQMEKFKKPVDLSDFRWNVDVSRAETLADMKLFAETMRDETNKHEDIKDIVDTVSTNIEKGTNFDKHIDDLNEEIDRNAERLKHIREAFAKMENDKFTCKFKVDSMEDINRMSNDQLDNKLKELFQAMEDLRVSWEGPGCLPELRAGLEQYQKLLSGAQHLRPMRQPFVSLEAKKETGKSIREAMLAKAKSMNVSARVIESIKKMPEDDVDNEKTLRNLMEMATEKNIPNNQMPKFIKSTLTRALSRQKS